MSGLLDILFTGESGLTDLGSLRVHRGDVLIREGASSEAVYFVVAGRFRVERGAKTIGYIEAGSLIGEIGFFTGTPRTANVIAFRDSLVMRLTREDYETHCARFPGLREAIISELASRLADRYLEKDIETRDRTRPRAIALLGAGDERIPERLVERLSTVLRKICRLHVVSRTFFRNETAGASPDSIDGVDWFSRNERVSDLTLYLPDPSDQPWQRAIVRQSDQVVFVARAGPPPALAPIEEFVMAQVPAEQRRLLLIHPKRSESVCGTPGWLRSRPVMMHHHVALHGSSDISRFARFLTGTARGLVLSGGGAYGLAHVGVERSLTHAGMGFDAFGGTSVGSAIAAAFSMGVAGDTLADRIEDIFVRSQALRRMTIPRYSLFDHKTFDTKLREHFTEIDIADIWMPFYAVATNLDGNRIDIIRSGPLWEAIRASGSLPGILPPFIRGDGALLVDGGLLDNLPYRAMHELKAGPNVVVSLARERTQPEGYSYDRIPGRAGLLASLLSPGGWRERVAPSVTETILRSMMAGSAGMAIELGEQDWLLSPPLPAQLGLMNWKDAFALIEPARTYAEEQSDALLEARPALHRALQMRSKG